MKIVKGNCKSIDEAYDLINQYKDMPDIKVIRTVVDYHPRTIASLFKYNYLPYWVTIIYEG